MPRKIVNLEIEEVSPVDNPANGRNWLLIKQGETFSCECIECGYKMESEEHCSDIECPRCGGTMRREERPGSGEKESSLEGGEKMNKEEILNTIKQKDEDLAEGVKSLIEDLEKRLQNASESLEELKDGEEESINKSELPEAVRKRLEATEKRAEEAEKIAKKEREARETVELRKELSEYKSLGEVDKMVDIVKALGEDLQEDFVEILKSVKERVNESALFDEIGDSGEGGEDSKLEKRVQSYLEKNPELTRAQAVAKVLDKNPELYEE